MGVRAVLVDFNGNKIKLIRRVWAKIKVNETDYDSVLQRAV